MTRWLIRFGYDGRAYAGWARQPGLRTVEGEIRSGVVGLRIASDVRHARVTVASRTDRGVNARANALALSTDLPGAATLRALNGIAPDLWFLAASEVPDDFPVRRASRRTYRYYDPRPVRHRARRAEAARLFRGTIDIRSFARGVAASRPIQRPVESVTSRSTKEGAIIEVRARSFVWGMVRKIVAALREVDAGRLSVPRLRAATEGRIRLTLPMAEAAPLILWEVEYPQPWQLVWSGPNRRQTQYLEDHRAASRVRSRVLASIPPETPTPAQEA